MKIIENIKRKSALSALNQSLRLVKRNKLVHNLTTARRVGLISTITDLKDFDELINFQRYLADMHIQATLMGYFPGKEVPLQLLLRKGAFVFSKNDVNWYGKPSPGIIAEFCKAEYEILIDFSNEEVFPVRWVVAHSKAKFKVGNSNYHGNAYDLIISTDKSKGLLFYIEQVKHYLHVLNNRFAEEVDETNPSQSGAAHN